MPITKKEYSEIAKKKSPPSPIIKNMILAFLFGGAICTAGQWLMNLYESFGLQQEMASSGVSITLIFIAALLTGLKIYDNIAKYAGAGTLIPITGFANSIVAPALEFKSEGHILGMSAKMFIIAGPVLVYGIVSSVLFGLILWIFRLY
jgi:stage V sporulation protein AC